MRIKKHDKSYIVELEDGSAWRIWPGDLVASLCSGCHPADSRSLKSTTSVARTS